MPAKSQAQRAYLYAKFGAAWAKKHGFDNPGKLPARVGKKKAAGKKIKKAKPKTAARRGKARHR